MVIQEGDYQRHQYHSDGAVHRLLICHVGPWFPIGEHHTQNDRLEWPMKKIQYGVKVNLNENRFM